MFSVAYVNSNIDADISVDVDVINLDW